MKENGLMIENMDQELIHLRNVFLCFLYNRNGDIYTGEWNTDKMHGKGRFVTKDGRVCDGEFKNHRF